MEAVIYDPLGTARALAPESPWRLAGKSGTAQVFSVAQDEEYNEEELAERMPRSCAVRRVCSGRRSAASPSR